MEDVNKKRVMQGLFTLVVILSAYYAVRIYSEIKKDSMLGESSQPATISFTGHGEVEAVPDIANVSFAISKDATTVKDAQAAVAVIEKKALDVLKAKNVAEKDTQTADASFSPKYQYSGVCNQMYPNYCPPGNQVIVGYTASENISVKIRNTDDVGAIMQGLGTTGVSNLNGPNFAIDNPDVLQAQARKKAIEDAQAKAKVLARDLGVSLGKISSFNENGNSPIFYDKALPMSVGASAPAPAQIPKGQNTISSDVTITYEIR